MPDFLTDNRVRALKTLLEVNQRDWAKILAHRKRFLRHIVGQHHGTESGDKVPIPALEMARSAYAHRMVSQNPRVLAATERQSMRSAASDLELAVNYKINELNMVDAFQQAHYEAFACIGCMKIGREVGPQFEFDGTPGHVGGAFADSVSAEDLFIDLHARKVTELHCIGDKYKLPLNEVEDNEFFDEKARKNLKPHESRPTDTSASGLTVGDSTRDTLLEEVQLGDLYFPRQRVIATFAVDDKWNILSDPLREEYFEGPPNPLGPYRLLVFNPFPGTVVGLPPFALWYDLADLSNQIFCKIARQALRQKTMTTYRGESEEDAQRIVDSTDGETVKMNDPQAISEFRTGGADAPSIAFFMQTRDLFGWSAGNLDLLGGLAPQSSTAKQDSLLAQNASVTVDSMQQRFVNFMGDVCKDLAWHVFNDDLYDPPLWREAPGAPEVRARVYFDQANRIGDILDYDIRIEPYSWQRRSPSEKLQAMMQVWQAIIAPTLPLMQQQGIVPNIEGLLKMAAKYLDMSELEDMVTFTSGQPEQPVRSSGGSRASGGTKHTISERRNAPQATRGGQNEQMMRMLSMAERSAA